MISLVTLKRKINFSLKGTPETLYAISLNFTLLMVAFVARSDTMSYLWKQNWSVFRNPISVGPTFVEATEEL